MSNYSIGVDLGGTNLRVGGFLPNGECLSSRTLRTRLADGPATVITDLVENVRVVQGECDDKRTLVGIGIGTPGPLELPVGILRNPPNLVGWDGFPLRETVERALGRVVLLENDANLAALAEWLFGAGRHYACDSMCMLTLGTGVGSGFILRGTIWNGMHGMGGEAGHVPVTEDGVPCGCGGHGCLEQYASAKAICRMAQERGVELRTPGDLTAEAVANLAANHEAAAMAVFRQVGKSLGIALAGLINTLNLPLYAIGGGVAKAWDLFAPAMFEEIEQRSYVYRLTRPVAEPDNASSTTTSDNQTHIVPAQCGSGAGLLGAALLPFRVNGIAISGEDFPGNPS